MSDDEFFTATEQLAAVGGWARARYAARWAVLGAVLTRVDVNTPSYVQLPATIGGRASLNLLSAFVGPSGAGKGTSDRVAREAYPAPIIELPIGSGEGIAETFKVKHARDTEDAENDPDRIDAALFSCSEIDVLTGIASRQGSTILGALKAMAMGEQLGQTLATKGASRLVPAHSYRAALSVGGQPGHTGVIFDDATGGTPQRFLWWRTTDPTMPAEPGPEPAPLNTTPPRWHMSGGVAEIVYGPAEIRETIVAAHLARQRGEGDALDGHALLTRCKVAALLAILHGRQTITELDWHLSAAVMAHSDATRAWLLAEAKRISREKSKERAIAQGAGQVAREAFVNDHKLNRAKAAVLRWLERHGELPANQLRSKLKADLRDHLGAAIAELVADGQIIEITVDRGCRYRRTNRDVDHAPNDGAIPPEVHPVPEVHPPYSQVKEGVPEVQGVPAAAKEDAINSPQSDITPALHATRSRSRRCGECSMELPSASRDEVCEDCAEGGFMRHPDPDPVPPKPVAVIHSGATREDYDAEWKRRSYDQEFGLGVWRRSGEPVTEGGAA